MNPDIENPYSPPDTPAELPLGPGERLLIESPTVVGMACGSFLAVLMLYLMGQLLVLLNLPVGLIMTSLCVFGAAGLFFPAASNLRPFAFTGLRAPDFRLIGLALVIGTVNLPVANFLMAVAVKVLPASWSSFAEETTQILADASPGARILLVIAAAVAAPIGEELFFRGWMQNLLVQRFRGVPSTLVVAFVFSATHGDPVGFVARVELGLLFGLARLWSGSLWPGITMHATHNLLSTTLFYLAGGADTGTETPDDWVSATLWASASLAAMVLLMRAFRRQTEMAPPPPSGELVPFRFTPRPALRILRLDVALVVAGVVGLRAFGSHIPGMGSPPDSAKMSHPEKLPPHLPGGSNATAPDPRNGH